MEAITSIMMSVFKEVYGLDDSITSNPDKTKPDTTNSAVNDSIASITTDDANNTNEGDVATKKKENTFTTQKVKNALIRVRLEDSAQSGRAR